jgi:ABC-2 type transport system permease protein
MFSVLKKELLTFFGSATGYIVICLFLLLNGLFLWIIPGDYNIPDNGYANVDGLFYLAPWLYLFLCPAVTMRFFSEERLSGTWELLITKPLSKWAIVLGKFFAGWILVLLALLPTVIYYFTVSYIAEPEGNVDSGAFWASFIGLGMLASIYTAVGVLASALSSNQIISFIVAAVLSFFMLYGFDLAAGFLSQGNLADAITNLGILKHYSSISRGVIDLHDMVYFLASAFVFLWLAERAVERKE